MGLLIPSLLIVIFVAIICGADVYETLIFAVWMAFFEKWVFQL